MHFTDTVIIVFNGIKENTLTVNKEDGKSQQGNRNCKKKKNKNGMEILELKYTTQERKSWRSVCCSC